jgi:hypothetical protein
MRQGFLWMKLAELEPATSWGAKGLMSSVSTQRWLLQAILGRVSSVHFSQFGKPASRSIHSALVAGSQGALSSARSEHHPARGRR